MKRMWKEETGAKERSINKFESTIKNARSLRASATSNPLVAGTSIPSATTGCLPNLRPSRRPRACSRSRRCPGFPGGWRSRRPQCCPGRHEPRRASRGWRPPRDSRQRVRPASGQQPAIDTTCISPITRAAEPDPGADASVAKRPGPPLPFHRFCNRGWRPLGKPCRSPGPSRTHVLLKLLLGFVRPRRMRGSPAGPLSLPSRHNGRSQPPCSSSQPTAPASAGTSLSYPSSWRMTAGKPRLDPAACLPPNTGWRARPRTSAGKMVREKGKKIIIIEAVKVTAQF